MKYDLAIENNCAHLGQKLILFRYLLDAEIRLNCSNSASVHFTCPSEPPEPEPDC